MAGFRATLAKAAADGDHQVILAGGVSNQASDAVHLLSMLERIQVNTDQLPDVLAADAGCCSTANLGTLRRGVWMPTSPPTASNMARGPDRRGVESPEISMLGAGWTASSGPKQARRCLSPAQDFVEPVFIQIIKSQRPESLRLRGLAKANGEWALMATTHNIPSCSGHRSPGPEGLAG